MPWLIYLQVLLRCQGLSPDALFGTAKRYARKLSKDSRLTEAVRIGNVHLVMETIQQLEKEKARTDYDYLSKLLTKLDAANHTSPIQWEPAGTVFAVMPTFFSNVDIQLHLLTEFNCDSSANFLASFCDLDSKTLKVTAGDGGTHIFREVGING